MSKVGILVETENGAVKETTLGTLTAGRGSLAADSVYALVPGEDPAGLAEMLGQYGAGTVVQVTGDAITKNPDQAAGALAEAMEKLGLNVLVATASAIGQDLCARVAARRDIPFFADCLAVDSTDKKMQKSWFSGKMQAVMTTQAPDFVCSVRANAIEPVPAPAQPEITTFETTVQAGDALTILEVVKGSSAAMDLTEAPVVITGGRAIGEAKNYQMLEECASVLGGAVGASRAAVDAGYAPHSMQVGQTGKTVSPKLYIACGVSGAVQHFAGMQTAKIIVAINNDKDAPIFNKCDYGVVGDIFEVIPALTRKLQE